MSRRAARAAADPIRLEVFHHLLAAWCEESGTLLQRSAISPNIRERRDFSVALFDRDARLCAQAAHIPVHLGSAADSVRAVQQRLDLAPGDLAMLNDPFAGGTHLPDVTLVRPVFLPRRREPAFFLCNRAHHADIGGATPGSMGIAGDLIAEGLVIPPVHLWRRDREVRDVVAMFCANVRGADQRRIDLAAQASSLLLLERRVRERVADEGLAAVEQGCRALHGYAERIARDAIAGLRRGTFTARDVIEDDGCGGGPLPIVLHLHVGARLRFDFRDSAPQARGGVNCNRSVLMAACVYALRCLCPDRLPTNDGLFRLIELQTRRGTIVDPRPNAPVAGGNVETSQRLVDVAFAALRKAGFAAAPAASAGTMSNFAAGGQTADGRTFAFYETLPGGAGATAGMAGASAIQTHMTNTRNTPVEEFEHRFPLCVESLTVRRGSGGRGRRRGGDGLHKSVRALVPMTATFLGERHRGGPPGAAGGATGSPGRLLRRRGEVGEALPSKCTIDLAPGDVLAIDTPGGGGHGR